MGVLWGALGALWGSFGGPLGVLWGSGGRPEWLFGGLVGVLGGSWGVHGGSFGFLVASGSVSGIFRETPGGILAAIIFRDIFRLRFLIDFGRLLERFLKVFWFIFGGLF